MHQFQEKQKAENLFPIIKFVKMQFKCNLRFVFGPAWMEAAAIDCVTSCTSLATDLAFLGNSWTRLASVLNGLIWSSDRDLFCFGDCGRGGDDDAFEAIGPLRGPLRSCLGPRHVVLTGAGLDLSSVPSDSTKTIHKTKFIIQLFLRWGSGGKSSGLRLPFGFRWA